ncbi:MAG: GNAT family N-acetyltransferase, partial [Pseudomonadota bacterium]
ELDRDGARQLTAALSQTGDLLFGDTGKDWSLRAFRPGDMGHVSARQAMIYQENYGWGEKLEALILEITATFLREFKPGREQCWIAERDHRMLGSVFLVEEDERTARLRLLYVEAEARGLGIGSALVRQCTKFAREAGYERIVLWTHAVLHSARNIYAKEGYTIVETEVQNEFGKEETSEHWLLEL